MYIYNRWHLCAADEKDQLERPTKQTFFSVFVLLTFERRGEDTLASSLHFPMGLKFQDPWKRTFPLFFFFLSASRTGLSRDIGSTDQLFQVTKASKSKPVEFERKTGVKRLRNMGCLSIRDCCCQKRETGFKNRERERSESAWHYKTPFG